MIADGDILRRMPTRTLAERVQWWMDQTGLKQTQIVERSRKKLTQSYLSMILAGQRPNPGMDKLVALAAGLGVDLTWLATGRGEPERGVVDSDQVEDLLRIGVEAALADLGIKRDSEAWYARMADCLRRAKAMLPATFTLKLSAEGKEIANRSRRRVA